MPLDNPRKGRSRKESGLFETPASTAQKTRDKVQKVQSVVSYTVSGGASAFAENILRQKGFSRVESIDLENGVHLISVRAIREDIESALKSMRGVTYKYYIVATDQVAC